MSSLSKALVGLPIPWLLVIVLQSTVVVLVLMMLKWSLKWWDNIFRHKRAIEHAIQNSNMQGNRVQISAPANSHFGREQHSRDMKLKTIKAMLSLYSLIEPCWANLSMSKLVFMAVVQVSLYCLMCTQLMDEPQDGIIKLDFSQTIRMVGYLGWVGLVLVMLSLGISLHTVGALTRQLSKQKGSQSSLKSQKEPDSKLPMILHVKLVGLASISIALCLASVVYILQSNYPSPSLDYLRLRQCSYYRVINCFIMLAILVLLHQLFLALLSLLLGVVFSQLPHMYQQRICICFFLLCSLQPQSSITANKITPAYEQSLQNLDDNVLSQPNNIYFQPPFQQCTSNLQKKQNQPINSKYDPNQGKLKNDLSHMQNKIVFRRLRSTKNKVKNKTSFTLNQLTINPDQFKNIITGKTNKIKQEETHSTNQQLQSLPYIEHQQNYQEQTGNEVTNTIPTTICHFQSLKKPSITQQKSQEAVSQFYTSNHEEQIIIKEKTKRRICTISEPVLCNIVNKISQQTSKKPAIKLKSKNQLKIRSFFENQHDIQMVDLSNYVVKNLGCVKSTTNASYSIGNDSKSCLLSRDTSTLKSLQNSQLKFEKRAKKRRSYYQKPNIPQQAENVHTFCLQDFKQNQ